MLTKTSRLLVPVTRSASNAEYLLALRWYIMTDHSMMARVTARVIVALARAEFFTSPYPFGYASLPASVRHAE